MALCVAMAVSAGCSALRFGYNQASDLAYWWLDGYVDFNDAQSVLARNAIASWFAWHRGTQLPDYAVLLARARERSAGRQHAGARVRMVGHAEHALPHQPRRGPCRLARN